MTFGGDIPMIAGESWHIRLGAIKVKKQTVTGITGPVTLSQTTGSQTTQTGTRFVYDEAGHLAGEYDATGKAIEELVWLEDMPVASIRPNAAGTGTAVYYIHPDHLGTPRQVTDATGKIVWRWDTTEPFGANYPDESPNGDGVKFSFNLRFPGQYYDTETGRHQNWFRDYDPSTGRYTTSDPIGLTGGMNRYAYVGGNPIAHLDSSGLSPDQACPAEKDCKKASPSQLKAAGITSEHDFKTGWGGVPNSRFDICACKDGSIVIKAQGACGKSGPSIQTDTNWKKVAISSPSPDPGPATKVPSTPWWVPFFFSQDGGGGGGGGGMPNNQYDPKLPGHPEAAF